MSTNTEPAIKGTISHGTLRSEDLLGAFLGALDVLDHDSALALAHEVGETYQALLDGTEGAEEDAGWLLERMSDRINEALPEGWTFGAHEGDGSDFGVWWGWDDEPGDPDPEILDCIRGGRHLASCDDDGYCNACGRQEGWDYEAQDWEEKYRDALDAEEAGV